MRRIDFLLKATMGLLVAMFLVPAASAQFQAPAYLHALSDLRTARYWIQADGNPNKAQYRNAAIAEINKAIDEIKKNAHHLGEETQWTPPAQSHGSVDAPWHSALTLLKQAHADVSMGRDFPDDVGRQVRAIQHIDAATQQVSSAIWGH